MKNLSPSERRGITALAAICILIAAGAYFMRNAAAGSDAGDVVEVRIIKTDTVVAPAATDSIRKNAGISKKKTGNSGKKSKKKSAEPKKKAGKSKKENAKPRNPLDEPIKRK